MVHDEKQTLLILQIITSYFPLTFYSEIIEVIGYSDSTEIKVVFC